MLSSEVSPVETSPGLAPPWSRERNSASLEKARKSRALSVYTILRVEYKRRQHGKKRGTDELRCAPDAPSVTVQDNRRALQLQARAQC